MPASNLPGSSPDHLERLVVVFGPVELALGAADDPTATTVFRPGGVSTVYSR
jgi:hypothetical protein